MYKAKIIATGYYLPRKVLTNKDLERTVDTSDDWIRQRTGIRERRIAAEDQATSDLSLRAARMALERSGIFGEDLDCVIVGTLTPDYQTPSCAALVQDGLGAAKASAFDLSAACSGRR